MKYDYILLFEAWVNAIRTSSCIENFPQISAKPIAFQRNLLRKLSPNRPFFTNHFSVKLASQIPTKSAVFSVNLSPKIPRNLAFFPRNLSLNIPRNLAFFPATYQKPWLGLLSQNNIAPGVEREGGDFVPFGHNGYMVQNWKLHWNASTLLFDFVDFFVVVLKRATFNGSTKSSFKIFLNLTYEEEFTVSLKLK